MINTFLAILPLIGIAVLFLAIRVLLKKGGTFHSQHIGQSKAMRQRGIHCVQAQDKIEHASTLDMEEMQK
ncbi:MAG: hypothetical protein MJZ15_06145 [Bacteroidales bacterium]|nr:hypothetical protein [Bacteroidales bacterium]